MSRFASLLRALGLVLLLATPLAGCEAFFADYQINDAAFAGAGNLPISVTPTHGLQTTEWGSQATFTIALAHEPTSNVTITLSSSAPAEGRVTPTRVIFTKDDWRAPQVITVTGVDDKLVDGNQTYLVITDPAKSDDPSYNGKNPDDVELVNIDNETAGITVVPRAGLITTEGGGQDTFTVVLNSPPLIDVTISLSSDDPTEGTVSPDSLVFTPFNWMAPQLVTLTGVDDLENPTKDGPQHYTVTVSPNSDDQAYAAVPSVAVSATNQDNESAGLTVASVTGTDPIDPSRLRTTEWGDSATFSVALNAPPSADVTLSVTSTVPTEGVVSPEQLTFTQLNWNAPQIVTVTGQDDEPAIADGDQPYSITLGALPGEDADYSALPETHVQVTNVDNDKPGFTLTLLTGLDPQDRTKLVTSETGTTATFSVALNSQPSDTVSITLQSSIETEGAVAPSLLTFTTDNWKAPQKVSVTGVDDPEADGNAVFFIRTGAAVSDDPGYKLLDPPDLQVTNLDDDMASVLIALGDGQDPSYPGKLVTDETGKTATFSVSLSSKPKADVTIPLSSSNTNEGTISKSSLKFTPNNYGAPQLVTITGRPDQIVDGNQPYVIAIGTASSDDADYNGRFNLQVQVINRDRDTADVIVTPTSGLITREDGASASFTIRLQSRPMGEVTINLASSANTEGIPNVGSVTFTAQNWNIDQTVTVTGQSDPVQDGNQTYKIVTSACVSSDPNYQGKNPADVSLTNIDLNTAGFTVVPTAGLVTTEAGGKATFTIVLNSKPVSMTSSPATVKIPLSSSKPTEGSVSPASVTFTEVTWKTPQTVTVTGLDDKVADGDQPYLIVLALASSTDPNYNAHKPDDVSVTNTDDDIPGYVIVAAPTLKTSEKNAGSATFTVALKSQPTASVSIAVTSSNTAEGTVAPATLAFSTSNWSMPQTVTITGVQDDVVDGTQSYQVRLANAVSAGDPGYNGKFGTQLDVQNLDDDVAGFIVSGGSLLQTKENGGKATFSVQLKSRPAGTASVSLGLSSTNSAEGTVSPSSLLFTGADWDQAHTVTVTGIDDQKADGNVSYQVVFAAPTSPDATYASLPPPAAVSLTNLDDDQVGVQVLPTSCATTPGTSATFTIQLTSQPSANVSIALSSEKPLVGMVSPVQVTFTPVSGLGGWDTPQTVTVTGLDDGSISTVTPYEILTGDASAPGETTGYDGYSNVADVSCTNTTP